jgi:HEAT repeat protein
MSAPSLWGSTPRDSITAACAERGPADVVAGCVRLIDDDPGGPDHDPTLVAALAGPASVRFLDAPADQRYWLRVWGARGLLWALAADGAPAADEPEVTRAVVTALQDGHWRVREMALKVVARHRLDEAQPVVTGLLADGTPRVRAAAARALRLLAAP